MLKYRLISGLPIISALVALTLWGPVDLIHGVLVFLAGLAAFELTGMYEKGGYRPHRLLYGTGDREAQIHSASVSWKNVGRVRRRLGLLVGRGNRNLVWHRRIHCRRIFWFG